MSNKVAGEAVRGSLFVISAPSGAGKTSLVRALLERCSNLQFSVSCTTRPRREGERDGVDYHFVDHAGFEQRVAAGEFLEHAEVFGNYYGTSRDEVEQRLQVGQDVILEIDWQGAGQVRRHMPESVSIFILPPSREALERRLHGRGKDSVEVIRQRLAEAEAEMSHWQEFEYVIVNDDFDQALDDLAALVRGRRLRSAAQAARHAALLADLGVSQPFGPDILSGR